MKFTMYPINPHLAARTIKKKTTQKSQSPTRRSLSQYWIPQKTTKNILQHDDYRTFNRSLSVRNFTSALIAGCCFKGDDQGARKFRALKAVPSECSAFHFSTLCLVIQKQLTRKNSGPFPVERQKLSSWAIKENDKNRKKRSPRGTARHRFVINKSFIGNIYLPISFLPPNFIQ